MRGAHLSVHRCRQCGNPTGERTYCGSECARVAARAVRQRELSREIRELADVMAPSAKERGQR